MIVIFLPRRRWRGTRRRAPGRRGRGGRQLRGIDTFTISMLPHLAKRFSFLTFFSEQNPPLDPVLRIQIHWIWIRILNFSPIWTRKEMLNRYRYRNSFKGKQISLKPSENSGNCRKCWWFESLNGELLSSILHVLPLIYSIFVFLPVLNTDPIWIRIQNTA